MLRALVTTLRPGIVAIGFGQQPKDLVASIGGGSITLPATPPTIPPTAAPTGPPTIAPVAAPPAAPVTVDDYAKTAVDANSMPAVIPTILIFICFLLGCGWFR